MLCNYQWVYSSGLTWINLDENTQSQIERLWASDASNWIASSSFPGPVYVDTSLMVMVISNVSYTIARCRK
ncbi:hypothetical protein K501DRAFT_287966 [Backusella circina FSU 941]|nr:hypothetical protein K501DRAFT_287966 [Backusella circina FSU 941]